MALKLIFAGSGEFGLPTLRRLIESDHQVAQIVSQPDRPAGRGRRLTPTPVARFALDHHLPLLRTTDINREPLPAADVMVVIAFGQKIAPHQVDHPRLGSVNLHASRLPKYRGAAPINWAILNGEMITGNSVIRLANKMDAGEILAQSEVPIGELETAGELHDRLADDGATVVLDCLSALALGKTTGTPQDETQATLAPRLTREATPLDWTRPAEHLARQIRGLCPWPGCRVRLLNAEGGQVDQVTLVRARPAAGEGPRWNPGEIQTGGAITAGAAAYAAVEILELQPAGRRPMTLNAYRNGHPWLAGMSVESVI